MAELEVQIGADKSDFDKKIKEVELDIKQLSKEKAAQIKLGLDTSEITANIKDAKKYLNDLKTTAKDTGDAFQKGLSPKVANGGNALMQFSRIAQDAPFGIMGIGNNITATAESFGHLVKETGSAGGALKAVASSMLGTGGILLAVSLVTTGLTYMAQNGLTVQDVFDKLSGTFDETAKAMNDLNAEAAKNAQGDISSMNAYVSVAKDVNLSMSDRLIAVKKLQDEYPAYFGNLSNEQILNGNVAKAVQGVTDALIAKAKAAAFTGKIAELASEEFKIQSKITSEVERQSKMEGASKSDAEARASIVEKVLRGEMKLSDVLSQNGTRQDRINSIFADAYLRSNTALKDLGEELRNNLELQDKYTKKINESVAAQIKLETEAPKTKNPKKTFSTPQVSGLKSEIDSSGLVDLSGEVVKISKTLLGAEGVITTSMGNINVAVDSGLISMLESMYKFNQDLNSLIQDSVSSTFSNLGTSIGEALANGENVITSIGNSLLSSLGSFLSDLGGLLIKYGLLAITKGKLDTAIAVGGPVSVAAGVAAIAVGTALKVAGSAIGNRAKAGSSVSENTGATYSSPASPSYGVSSGGNFGNGTVVFEISGTSLIGVLSNTLDKNKRLGGNLGI